VSERESLTAGRSTVPARVDGSEGSEEDLKAVRGRADLTVVEAGQPRDFEIPQDLVNLSDLRILPTNATALRIELVIPHSALVGPLGGAIREKIKQGNPTSEGLRALLAFYVQRERMWSS
jgi:hypothetical protein